MPINVTSSSQASLTRTLNDLRLAAVEAAKLQEKQLEQQRERKTDGDKAASRLSEQLRQRSAADAQEARAEQALTNDENTKRNQAQEQQLLRARAEDERTPTLKSLVPAKAQLSPADELATFAATSGTQSRSVIGADAQAAQLQLALGVNSGEAVAEDGSAVEVEILAPQAQAQTVDTNSALVLTLQSRAQAATAALYARNSDVVFQSYPLSQIAA